MTDAITGTITEPARRELISRRDLIKGGALVIGLFETFVSTQVGDAWASAALYIAVLLVLTLRPRGLFGEPVGRRA